VGRNRFLIQGDFRAGAHAYMIQRSAALMLLEGSAASQLPIDAHLEALAAHFRNTSVQTIGRLEKSLISQFTRQRKGTLIDSNVG